MHIITHTCPNCGTIVSANELEGNRVMKCPGLDCEAIIRFEDLPEEDREHFIDNRNLYQL